MGYVWHRTQYNITQFHKGSSVIAYHTRLCVTERSNEGASGKYLGQTLLLRLYWNDPRILFNTSFPDTSSEND